MMGTFVYAPGVQIKIGSDRAGIVDVTDDVIAGSLQINVNRQHELSFTLSNPKHKYDGVFYPNDRIVVRMKRLKWVQVFSGYLNSVPLVSTWPGTVNFTASCTLKKLANKLYDTGAMATIDLFNSFSEASKDVFSSTMETGLTDRAVATLVEMGEWDEDKIHVGGLPPSWWASIYELWNKIRPELEGSMVSQVQSGASIYGSDSYTAGGGVVGGSTENPSIMGPASLTAEELYKWYKDKGGLDEPITGVKGSDLAKWYISIGNKYGVRGDLAFLQACKEAAYFKSNFARNRFAFAGIKAYDSNPNAAQRFKTPQEGVLGHIQFLKKVALGNSSIPEDENVVSGRPNADSAIKTYISELNKPPYVYATDPDYFNSLSKMWQDAICYTSKGYNKGSSAEVVPAKPSVSSWASSNSWVVPKQSGPVVAGSDWVFPAVGHKSRMSNNFGADRSWNRSADAIDKTHDGVDIGCPTGTPIVSVVSGEVIKVKSSVGSGAGRYVKVRDKVGDTYTYMHLSSIGAGISEGTQVLKGQALGLSGASGKKENSYAEHLHFEWRPGGGEESDPYSRLQASADDGSVPPDSLMTGEFATQSYDGTELSNTLIGPRVLLNDQGSTVLDLAASFFAAGMRDYCSAPNGDFIAWFPDYFNAYGTAAKMVVEDIELTDFAIEWSDNGFVTHQFVVGSVIGYGASTGGDEAAYKMLSTMGVASIEFPELLESILGPNSPAWTKTEALLSRFGPRVDTQTYSAVVSPEAEFFMAVKFFTENWAKQFRSTVDISFMPELWPGMIMQVPSRGVQFYVEQVSHQWSYSGGFSTSVSLLAPASIDGSLNFLPRAGAAGGQGQ